MICKNCRKEFLNNHGNRKYCFDCPVSKRKYVKEYYKFWRRKNRKKCVEYSLKWRDRNKEKYRKYRKRYFSTTKGKKLHLEQNKKWRKKYPEKRRHQSSLEYAREKNAKGSHVLEEWQILKGLYQYKCAICGKKKKLSKDHIVPLSKDGTNYISNIQPACNPCNSRKNNKIYV